MEIVHDYKAWAIGIKDIWQSQDIQLGMGVSENEIGEMGRIIGLNLPPSLIALYKEANGFENYGWNSNMFSIWPLDRILEEYAGNKDKNFVGFCDFLINSHCIGFLKGTSGIFKDYDQEVPVAATYEEAIELINGNSGLIY